MPVASGTITSITNDAGSSGLDFITSDTTLVIGASVSGVAATGFWLAGGTFGIDNGGKGTFIGSAFGAGAISLDFNGTVIPGGTYTITITDESGSGDVLSTQALVVDTTPPNAPFLALGPG